MLEMEGDLTSLLGRAWLVLPVNIGFKKNAPKDDSFAPCGPNVMGKGLAKEVAEKLPHLAQLWGRACFRGRQETAVCYDLGSRVIFFPTKPLNEEEPWFSWRGSAALDLVTRSLKQLVNLILPTVDEMREQAPEMARAPSGIDLPPPPPGTPDVRDFVFLPVVGCGNGRLPEREVLPLLHEHLDDHYVLIHHAPVDNHPF
jgi:hypothetical protein